MSRPAGVPYPGTRAGKSSLGTPRGGLPQGRSPAWLLAGRAPRRGKPSRKGGSRKGEEPLGVPAGLGTLTGPGPRLIDLDQIVRLISQEEEQEQEQEQEQKQEQEEEEEEEDKPKKRDPNDIRHSTKGKSETNVEMKKMQKTSKDGNGYGDNSREKEQRKPNRIQWRGILEKE